MRAREGAHADAQAIATADPGAVLPGRGAYLCRDRDRAGAAPECVAQAIRRNALSRALRAKVTLDPKLVESVGP